MQKNTESLTKHGSDRNMNKLKFFRTVALTFLLLNSPVFAQSTFKIGGNFTLGFPQNEFNENVENIGLGGTGHFAFNFPESPVSLGASIGFMIYGSETREEPFSLTIPDVFVDVTTTNNILLGHLFMRLQPPQGAVLPYLDGLIGFNYLWTETRVSDQDRFDDDEIASTKQLDDITFSYGVGGGLMIRVYEAPRKQNRKHNLLAVYIDLGMRYLKGGEAEYLKEGSIEIIDSDVIYHISKSTTDIITGHIGVSMDF